MGLFKTKNISQLHLKAETPKRYSDVNPFEFVNSKLANNF